MAAAVPAHQRDDGGEVAARAVSGDGDPARVDPERARVERRPLGRGITVFGCGGELRFRGEAVVDGDDDAVGALRELAAGRVVAVEAAENEAAAVEEDEARLARGAADRRVDADGDLAFRDRRCRGIRPLPSPGRARCPGIEPKAWRMTVCGTAKKIDLGGRGHGVEHGLRFGIERHVDLLRPGPGRPDSVGGLRIDSNASTAAARKDTAAAILGTRSDSKSGRSLLSWPTWEDIHMRVSFRRFTLLASCPSPAARPSAPAAHSTSAPTGTRRSASTGCGASPGSSRPWRRGPIRSRTTACCESACGSAIETNLTGRGFECVENPADADFLVTYGVVLDEKLRVNGGVATYGGYGGYGGYGRWPVGVGAPTARPDVRNYQESTLIIDFLDPASKDLVWRGWASGILQTRDRDSGQAQRSRPGSRRCSTRIRLRSPSAERSAIDAPLRCFRRPSRPGCRHPAFRWAA